MKYLKTYKIFENLEIEDILDVLRLWNMDYEWNSGKKELIVKFEYPDRVDKNEIETINKILVKIKPEILNISSNNLQGDCLKYLKLNDNLIELDCRYNKLTFLPKLSLNIKYLWCTGNEKIPFKSLLGYKKQYK